MMVKAEAVALRVDPFSRTSLLASWLTREHGRLVTLAKGAHRPRSDFRGQMDVFYTCEIVYYSATRSGLCTLKECAALDPRPALRQNIQASVCASYLCDLVQRLTPPGSPQEALYPFISGALDALCEPQPEVPKRILHWAELNLMGLLGMAPRLDRCTACGRQGSLDEPLNVISVPRGGVVCMGCRPTADEPLIPLDRGTMAILRTWQAAATPTPARRLVCSPEQRTGIEKVLGALLTYHLEYSPGRQIALSLLT